MRHGASWLCTALYKHVELSSGQRAIDYLNYRETISHARSTDLQSLFSYNSLVQPIKLHGAII